MSFGDELDAFRTTAQRNHIQIKRRAAFVLFSNVIFASPVDLGVFRNNWFASIGSASDETTTHPAPVGTATVNRVNDVLRDTNYLLDTFLTNNLPYAEPLENGLSAQAPDGIVRVQTLNWEAIVAEEARKVVG